MNNPQSLPPVPGAPRQSFGSRYGNKIALICALCVVLMVCAGFIWGFAYDRESDSDRVSQSIAYEWGGIVSIENVAFLTSDSSSKVYAPLDSIVCEAAINSEVLHRNIYQAEVYKADVTLSGALGRHGASADSIARPVKFFVQINAADVIDPGKVTINDRTFSLERTYGGLSARVPDELLVSGAEFKATFKVRGSEGFYFYPPVDKNRLIISGNSTSPSFQGKSLPVDRSVTDEGFTAVWQNISSKSDVPGEPIYDSETNSYVEYVDVPGEECYLQGSGGVDFALGIDTYRKVVRAIKYAFLIILLTFLTVFATEVLSRRNIPVLNYFLIGAALVVFYLLLLSIAEHLSFGYAYLISGVMTVGLICVYLRTMLHSRRLALYNASFLSALYGCCYVMLCVSTYALLVGSLLIFVALAFAMNISLRLQRANG